MARLTKGPFDNISSHVIKKGFETCGIYPLNRDAVLLRLPNEVEIAPNRSKKSSGTPSIKKIEALEQDVAYLKMENYLLKRKMENLEKEKEKEKETDNPSQKKKTRLSSEGVILSSAETKQRLRELKEEEDKAKEFQAKKRSEKLEKQSEKKERKKEKAAENIEKLAHQGITCLNNLQVNRTKRITDVEKAFLAKVEKLGNFPNYPEQFIPAHPANLELIQQQW